MTNHNPQVATVRVAIGPGYDVVIGPGVLGELGTSVLREGNPGTSALRADSSHGLEARATHTKPTKAAILVDQRIATMYAPRVAASLAAAGVESFVVPLLAAESAKTLEAAREAMVEMARHKLDRSGIVIALGGGLVGDVAGFCAAVYRRGVRFVQCPTTLLSMVDASVGGKTGVNLDIGDEDSPEVQKNFVGVFHQPLLVLADTDTLATLPSRDLRAGLAECIKHAMIAASVAGIRWPDALAWTQQRIAGVMTRDGAALTELIARNVELKARVVEGDEREERADGGRALLNLGHTFAHAIEPISHLRPDGPDASSPLTHGEAVGLGLVAAANAGASLGKCSAECAARVREAVRAAGLPDRLGGLPPTNELIERMGHDKKVMSNRLRIIIPHDEGNATVITDPPRSCLEAGWNSIRRE
ncbi:MAG: 3-dehydroquinate synthase family protein [Phycisphaerales bacterium]|jgi:3-dehydroquinate synthetase